MRALLEPRSAPKSFPFAVFQKMPLLGDLAKIAITWPLGHFWSRLYATIFSSLFAPKFFSFFAL